MAEVLDHARILLPNCPVRFDGDDFHRLLVHCTQLGASDIKIQTSNYVYIKLQGKLFRVTPRPLTPQEVDGILAHFYGANGPSVIKSGTDIDRGYEIHPSRSERYRYRMNVVGGMMGGQRAMEITARTIKLAPPTLAENRVEQGIVNAAFPHDGLVVVVGPTGSGKSTLIASIIGHICVQVDSHTIICTFESPIEYVYDTLNKPSTLIFQTEIGPGADLKNFSDAIRNAMRRAPDVIFTGETRDLDTMEGTLAAAKSGHRVYTTLHANSVVDFFGRAVNLFPESGRSSALNDLVNVSRLVVWQRLFIKPDGSGRVAIREFLDFTEDVRLELLTIGAESNQKMFLRMNELINEKGQSKAACAQRFYDEGSLSKADLLSLSGNAHS
jgi:defect-in-organelle-trafficking protein DotB